MLTGFKNAVEVDFTLEENNQGILRSIQKMEPDICRRKSTSIKKTCSTSDREPFHHGCMERP